MCNKVNKPGWCGVPNAWSIVKTLVDIPGKPQVQANSPLTRTESGDPIRGAYVGFGGGGKSGGSSTFRLGWTGRFIHQSYIENACERRVHTLIFDAG